MKKLNLSKQSLRRLSPEEMESAAGGTFGPFPPVLKLSQGIPCVSWYASGCWTAPGNSIVINPLPIKP